MDKDFVDKDMDKYIVVDLHVKELDFTTTTTTQRMMYADALSYEGQDTTKEELQEARERWNIS